MNNHLRGAQKEEGTFSEWENKMKRNWLNLINLSLTYKKNSQKFRKDCKWEPPPIGRSKLNFDGASRGNMGKACVGS